MIELVKLTLLLVIIGQLGTLQSIGWRLLRRLPKDEAPGQAERLVMKPGKPEEIPSPTQRKR